MKKILKTFCLLTSLLVVGCQMPTDDLSTKGTVTTTTKEDKGSPSTTNEEDKGSENNPSNPTNDNPSSDTPNPTNDNPSSDIPNPTNDNPSDPTPTPTPTDPETPIVTYTISDNSNSGLFETNNTFSSVASAKQFIMDKLNTRLYMNSETTCVFLYRNATTLEFTEFNPAVETDFNITEADYTCYIKSVNQIARKQPSGTWHNENFINEYNTNYYYVTLHEVGKRIKFVFDDNENRITKLRFHLETNGYINCYIDYLTISVSGTVITIQ